MTAKPDKANAAERTRQQRAFELRISGATYDKIAAELGYSSRSGAYNAVSALLVRVEAEDAQELRRLEGSRLDALHAAVWPQAISGDIHAVDRILRISERRSRLLGLDMPAALVMGRPNDTADVDFAETASRLLNIIGGKH